MRRCFQRILCQIFVIFIVIFCVFVIVIVSVHIIIVSSISTMIVITITTNDIKVHRQNYQRPHTETDQVGLG